MQRDPAWLAGVFDGCGFIDPRYSLVPTFQILFRNNKREVLESLQQEFGGNIEVYYLKCFLYAIEDPSKILEFLQLIKPHSLQPTFVDAGLYWLDQISKYPDPVAMLTGKKIAEKLREVNKREYPI